MNIAMVKDKKLNRRVAFRIYEDANLFYQKIDIAQLAKSSASFDRLLSPDPNAQISMLPDSQCLENDTLNVNISASGIAFTSKERLLAGDYLMLRILLLSSMTTIMTCCKVVYCKSSNPYENNRYPHLIGAQFVNLKPEDSTVLSAHIERKKQQQRLLTGVVASVLIFILAIPDVAFEMLVGLLHHIVEVVLHVIHLMFEYAEYNLDHVIEHAFHTDTHATQVIVFYILVSVGLIGLFFLGRLLPRYFRRAGNSLIAYGCRKKASCLYIWGEQSSAGKIKIVGISLVLITAYTYLNF